MIVMPAYSFKISKRTQFWEFAENFPGRRLNVGCGSDTTGDVRLDFSTNAPGATVIANIEDGFPFRDESFDLVIAYGIIEHLGNIYTFMNEVRRVLKLSGHLSLVTDNAAFFPIYIPGQRHNGGYKGTSPEDHHVEVFHYSHIVSLLNQFNFSNIEIELCYYKEKSVKTGLATSMIQSFGYHIIRPIMGDTFAQYFMPIIWARGVKSVSDQERKLTDGSLK